MGMAASSLRFAQLTARKNQVEFEGQQINQQRLTLSQKSTALFNDMLTKQVPTAPDPSQFTKVVYKFNNGFGNSSILNLAKKSSGPYNYSVTYKRPKTTNTLSRSSFTNVGFANHIGVTTTGDTNKNKASFYARTANIDGLSRNLSLIGGDTAAGKLNTYRSKLETYKNMKTIEEQISSLKSKKGSDTVSSSTQQGIKSALGLDLTSTGGAERNAFEKALFGPSGKGGLTVAPTPEKVALSTTYPEQINDDDTTYLNRQAAYNMAVALGLTNGSGETLPSALTADSMKQALATLADNANISNNLKNKLFDSKTTETGVEVTLKEAYQFQDTSTIAQDKIGDKFGGLNALEKAELANLLGNYANGGTLTSEQIVTDEDYEDFDSYNNNNYGKAANSLYNVATGNAADGSVTNDQMIKMLEELLKKISKDDDDPNGYESSGTYKTEEVDPAFTEYQSATATPGIQNVGEGQILYSYQDDNGDNCYMYVSVDNILDDASSTYADTVSVYENALNYLDGEYETEQQDANVIMSDDGQISKITFADGSVVTPEVVTEMDNAAYDQAMVEYEYKKQVYDKEMNDCNVKVKIIQAQDQKLEVRLKQLDTEQKALQTELDAVKQLRDKAIESSFKTFT